MATQIGPIISTVLQRVRDPRGEANSRDFTRKLLSHCQRDLNGVLAHAVETVELEVQPGLMFYNVSGVLPLAMNIVEVTHLNRTATRASLDQLRGISPTWSRMRGRQIQSYAPVGKNLLVLFPALTAQGIVNVSYVKDTGILNNEEETLSLLPKAQPILEAMMEITLLLKQRDLPEAQKAIELFGPAFQEITSG